jgi:regulator of extracellular matrix RemA (YlzA/DUF370 family)
VVVGLVEGGSVVIVTVVEAAAPLERLNGEAGLKEQLAPASEGRLQDTATELAILVMGVIVSLVDPDCPAGMVRFEELVAKLKLGRITLTYTLATAPS